MNSPADKPEASNIRGYLEGYYGKLFTWEQRIDVLKFLSSKKLNTYCYAPKEDPNHRLQWRAPYSADWIESFSRFAQIAKEQDVSIVAGIAPGLDFTFEADGRGNDFDLLLNKAQRFLSSGATDVLVLWDDIDEDGYINRYGVSEGAAHAQTVNQLADVIGQAVWTVPRVYASDIENTHHYLEDFFNTLHSQHTVLLCGKAIVPSSVQPEDLTNLCRGANKQSQTQPATKHRTVVWDNFYAHDYCPRRLFVGPWTGRDNIEHYLLNPTGMPFTDQLLLDVAASTQICAHPLEVWQSVLSRHGVPEEFQLIAPYFSHPFFGDQPVYGDSRDTHCAWPNAEPASIDIEQAIEHCLWKWKSPLAREWYPYIFGLKHDLAIQQNALPEDRILKTQSPALAYRLLR